MGTTERLNEPFLIGGPGSTAVADNLVLPVSIDSRSYLVDTSRNTAMQERFRRQSVQLLNSQQNLDKGESALTTPEVWRRTYKSWHHGMGQKFADRADSDEFRYEWSKGINPWERWEVSLLHDTTQVSHATGGEPVPLATSDGLLANGCLVALKDDRSSLYLTNGAGLSGTFALASPSRIATDGYYVYALGDDAILRRLTVTGSSAAVASTIAVPLSEAPALLLMANYKLVVATVTGKVYDITAYITAGTPPALPAPTYVPPVPTVTFIAGCSGKTAIYMMSVVGAKTLIHGFDIIRTTSAGMLDTLTYAGVAAELPDGEKGKALYSYLGYIAIGTDRGFRFAAVGEGITYGPLIETPGPVTAFEGQDRFLYYAQSNFHGDTGIGRADLSQFVADLQPAYASDLMSNGGHASSTVSFIVTLPDGRVMFGTSGAGIWAETDKYVPSGEITMSAWTFNVVDPKIGMYIASQTSVESGGKGSLHILYDQSPNEVPLGNYHPAHQKFSLDGISFHSASLRARLSPNGVITDPDYATRTPRIFSLEMRSTYARGKASEWQVPCIIHDEILMDNGTTVGRDVIADFDHLMNLVETGRQFVYAEDGQQWSVYATDFIWSPQERSEVAGWQGVFTIYFREVR